MKIINAMLILILISCKAKTQDLNFYGHWAEGEDYNVSFTLLNNGVIKYFEDNDIYHYSVEDNKLKWGIQSLPVILIDNFFI